VGQCLSFFSQPALEHQDWPQLNLPHISMDKALTGVVLAMHTTRHCMSIWIYLPLASFIVCTGYPSYQLPSLVTSVEFLSRFKDPVKCHPDLSSSQAPPISHSCIYILRSDCELDEIPPMAAGQGKLIGRV
jgi:hypothetical protein